MLFSMTGFGEAQFENDDIRIAFRIRSVNNKGLDVQLKLPYDLCYLERALRALAKGKLFRGRVDVFVEFEVKNTEWMPPVSVDQARVSQLIQMVNTLTERPEINGLLDVNTLVRMPDLLKERRLGFEYPKEIQEDILTAFSDALDRLAESRAQEGRQLLEDIQERVNKLEVEIEPIKSFVEERRDTLRERILKRIKDLNADVTVDENRLSQEIVFYADRLDISEEITRLGAHLKTMSVLLMADKYPKGRELEFLLQEQFREITTIGNKVKLLEAADRVVTLKTECEKIKEQILNVE